MTSARMRIDLSVNDHFIAGTGHRPDKCGGYNVDTRQKMQRVAREYLALAPQVDGVLSGMALGWDQALAHAAIDLNLPVVACVPFKAHGLNWPAESQAYYRKLLDRCFEVVVVCPGPYSAEAMQIRNEYMVENAARVVALFNGSAGGTANCIRYANTRGVPVDNVWSDYVALA